MDNKYKKRLKELLYTKTANLKELLYRTLEHIEVEKGDSGDDNLLFFCTDGAVYQMLHFQECCEDVWLEDICGNISDLVGVPITMAEERTEEEDIEGGDACLWTFYRFATAKGYVTLRWCGVSHHYSIEVNFVQHTEEEEEW